MTIKIKGEKTIKIGMKLHTRTFSTIHSPHPPHYRKKTPPYPALKGWAIDLATIHYSKTAH